LKIEILALGAFEANSYLLVAEDGRQAILIDAPDQIEPMIDLAARLGVTPELLVHTHGHVDHMSGNETLKRRWPHLKIAIHEADAEMLVSPERNLSTMTGQEAASPPADRLLKDGDKISLGEETLEVLHTPGHTPGGICLYLARPRSGPPLVITGDTLFSASIGRSDFPGGNSKTLLRSIRTKLLSLPDETVCYPGHGPPTTIGQERRENPFLL
jgi:glyoxylase-like metal-dependent hydrolase (beta-lactamase superfamily II)